MQCWPVFVQSFNTLAGKEYYYQSCFMSEKGYPKTYSSLFTWGNGDHAVNGGCNGKSVLKGGSQLDSL